MLDAATHHRSDSKSVEMMLDLHRRRYLRAAATANCGHPAGQYDVALVDWRRHTLSSLETTLDWLMNFLSPLKRLVVFVDTQKPAANDSLHALLEKRGFVIEQGTLHECGCALSAPRRRAHPMRKAG